MFNVLFVVKKTIEKPVAINIVLATSFVIYCCSYLPLIRATGLTLVPPSAADQQRIQKEVLLMDTIHDVCFSVGSFLYVGTLQTRFRVIRTIIEYPKVHDLVWGCFTILLWILLGLAGVIVLPIVYPLQYEQVGILSGAIWSFYVLFVDNFIAFVFLYQLLKFKGDADPEERQQRTTLITALVVLSFVSWGSLGCAFASVVIYGKDPEMRSLWYHIGQGFSAFLFTGSMVFMYSINALFRKKKHPKAKADVNSRDLIRIPSQASLAPAYPPRQCTCSARSNFAYTESIFQGNPTSNSPSVESKDENYMVFHPKDPVQYF
ncbi:hypothetical protein HDV01_003947 [Terramyces sp. JEL0728]|nr:hypothetical protein HDV01_003947 [Terramyces sp. JEL0728]